MIYRWFASHPFTSRVIGGEIHNNAVPFSLRPERFREWNCYVSVNPCEPIPRVKARDTDITTVSRILVDLDPIDGFRVPTEFHEAAVRSLEYEISVLLGYLPHIEANHTGRGLQMLLGVSEWPVNTVLARQEWRSTVKRFLIELSSHWSKYGLHVDTCTSDLSRLCRALDTINQDTNFMSYNVMSNDGALIDAKHFISRFSTSPLKSLESVPGKAHHKSWWVKFPHLTVAARRFISEGAAHGERNAAAYAAAISCLEADVSPEDTLAALRKGNKLSSPPMDESELRTVLSNALRRRKESAPY